MDCLPPVRVVTLVPVPALTGRDGKLTPKTVSPLKSLPVGVVVHVSPWAACSLRHIIIHGRLNILLLDVTPRSYT